MKKSLITLTIMLAAAAMIAAFSCPAQAAVSGPCVECHTMHNSQGGDSMAVNELNADMATPYAHLTMSTCVGCHFTATIDIPAPKIDGAYGTTSTAGGTFLESGTGCVVSDAGVHNVLEGLVITSTLGEDDTFVGAGDIPGLASGNMNAQGTGSNNPNDLTCAGMKGCHGDATVDGNDAGIRGFHHGSKTGFRYLQIGSTQAAVAGNGSSDWEKGGADVGNHNVYSSSDTVGINKLCANCHPDFHGETNTKSGSNWIRHPTDNAIPTDDGWNATVDYENNPFAFVDVSGLTTGQAYTTSNAEVACISCHRAHGTPYDDILRWDYDGQEAGSTTAYGCLGCHNKQRGS